MGRNWDHLKQYQIKPGEKRALGTSPAHVREVRQLKAEMLAACTAERMRAVVERHFELIQSKNGKVAIAALQLLYERLFGKATQPIEVTQTKQAVPFDPASYSDDQLRAVLDILDNPAQPPAQLPAPGPQIIDVEVIRVDPVEELPDDQGNDQGNAVEELPRKRKKKLPPPEKEGWELIE